MNTSDEVVKLRDVIQSEGAAIRTRREAVGLDPTTANRKTGQAASNGAADGGAPVAPGSRPSSETAAPENLRGLALSGGGIRAACAALGLVQALDEKGLMRRFDYLSTVSGGGYLGAYLSSSVLAGGANHETLYPDLKAHRQEGGSNNEALYPDLKTRRQEAPDLPAGQSERVQRFVFGGKYLHRPWQLANKYLVGLFFTNLPIIAGLIAFGSLVAFVWRSLDYQVVRDFLSVVNLDYDTDAAFLPFVFFLLLWLAAWTISYWRRGAEAPGKAAQVLLYFTVGSFLVGVVVLLVNVQNGLSPLQEAVFGETSRPRNLVTGLLATLVAGLLPFLRPQELFRRGLHPKSIWDKVIFVTACTCLLLGVPLVAVGVFAIENISGVNKGPGEIRSDDIDDWPAFCNLIQRPGPDDATTTKLTKDDIKERLVKLKSKSKDDPTALTPDEKSQQHRLRRALLPSQCTDYLINLEQVKKSYADLHDEDSLPWKFYRLAGWWEGKSPARQWYDDKAKVDRAADEICKTFTDELLNTPWLTLAIANDAPARVSGWSSKWNAVVLARSTADKALLNTTAGTEEKENDDVAHAKFVLLSKRIENLPAENDKQKKSKADLTELIRPLKNGPDKQTESERQEFNHALLVGLNDECFRNLDEIRRSRVIVADQDVRLSWLMWSALVLFLGLWVDLNGTSLHRFYRNRLAHAFIEPQGDVHPEVLLSKMDTTAHGAPYHLINASLNRFDSRFGNLIEKLDDGDDRRQDPDSRSTRNFLFSQLFCGSEVTDFRRTEHYEGLAKDYISLADAVALSGAAVEPAQFDFAPLAWMMTALNCRLGQWLPNPGKPKPRWYVKRLGARVVNLVPDAMREVKNRDFCFISDGGFTENLGIVPLLKRRCKLIVALDAGCDPKHEFSDLARVIRYARLKEGIRIERFSGPEDWSAENAEPAAECRDVDITPLHLGARGNCKEHFLVARIRYPEPTGGKKAAASEPLCLLVYIKPSFTGDESVDLLQYRGQDDEFPHNTTADQLYNDVRVECYRQLGYHMGERVCQALFPKTTKNDLEIGDLEIDVETRLEEIRAEADSAVSDRLSVSLNKIAAATTVLSGKSPQSTSEPRVLHVALKGPPADPIDGGSGESSSHKKKKKKR